MRLKSVGFATWYSRIRRDEVLVKCTDCGGKANGINRYKCPDCSGEGDIRCNCCGHVRECEECGGAGKISRSFTCGRCDGLGVLLPVAGELRSLERVYRETIDKERRLAALWQVEVV